MDLLDELKQLTNAAAEKNGRMNADERQRAARVLRAMWEGTDMPNAEVLSCMDRLPSEAISEAFGATWQSLDSDRRSAFLRWLPVPSSERSIRRVLLVAASVLDNDASTCVDLMETCLPPDDRPFTKELKALVSSTFFDRRSLSFEGLTTTGKSHDTLLKVLDLLLQAAIEKKVTIATRYPLVCIALRVIAQSRSHRHPTALSVLNEIEGDIREWHVEFLTRFEAFLHELDEGLFDRLRPPPVKRANAVAAMPEATELPVQAQGTYSTGSKSEDVIVPVGKERIFELLDSNIATARSQVVFFETIRGAFDQLITEQRAVQAGLIEAQAQISALNQSLTLSVERITMCEKQIEEKIARIAELEESLKASRDDFDIERKDLIERMHLNAQGMLEEFKNSLGVTLRKLFDDLPSAEGDFNADLARFVLARVQQVVESLEERGVKIRVM